MPAMRRALQVVADYRRANVSMNVIYYGLVIIGMLLVVVYPEVQQSLLKTFRAAFKKGPMKIVADAYIEGRVFWAILLTFVVNLVLGAFVAITLPSMVIPFIGLLIGVWRATLWGLILSPAEPELRMRMIPHLLTLILEGQAYILAMLATYVQGKAFLWPRSVGVSGHLEGYRLGLRHSARLYLLIVILLAVSAVYEALEVIYLLPLLG